VTRAEPIAVAMKRMHRIKRK